LEGRGESDVVAELGVAVIHGAGEDGIGAARGVADGLGGARAGVVSVLSGEDDVRLDVQGLDVDESGTEPGPSGELDGRLRHRALPSRDLVQVVDLAANFLVLAAVAHLKVEEEAVSSRIRDLSEGIDFRDRTFPSVKDVFGSSRVSLLFGSGWRHNEQ
jgi:hypothetical protein